MGEFTSGRFLQFRAGIIPIADFGGAGNVGPRNVLGRWDERGFVDGAVGAGDLFRGVNVRMKGVEGELAAQIWEVGFGGRVGW